MLLVPLLAFAPGCASAPSPAAANGPAVSAAFFALSVSDVDRVAAWYVEHLGFRQELESDRRPQGPRGVILVREGARLELLQFSSARPRAGWGMSGEAHEVHGILKIGFEVRDLDALFAALQSGRVEQFFPIVRPPGSSLRTFGVKDPDGNIVQFFGR